MSKPRQKPIQKGYSPNLWNKIETRQVIRAYCDLKFTSNSEIYAHLEEVLTDRVRGTISSHISDLINQGRLPRIRTLDACQKILAALSRTPRVVDTKYNVSLPLLSERLRDVKRYQKL